MTLTALPIPCEPPIGVLDEAQRRACRLGRPVLLSLARPLATVGDPLPLVAAARAAGCEAVLLARPADGHTVAGIDAAWSCTVDGEERFAHARTASAALLDEAVVDGDTPPPALAAFAFAERATPQAWNGFPAGRVVVPQIALTQRGTTGTFWCSTLVAPGEEAGAPLQRLTAALARWRDCRASIAPAACGGRFAAEATPAPEAWLASVGQALDAIRNGCCAKLVLARACRLTATRPFDCTQAVARLRQTYPGCTTYWFGGTAGDFLGATPEPLVAVHQRAVTSAALAGTCARGTSVAADEALAAALLASDKERREHALVVEALGAALGPLCDTLEWPDTPTVLRLPNVQHLLSPLRGRLAARTHVLDLVARLHPSPAVAGFPRAAALAALPACESIERGWYAGPLGWFDAAGNGEFVVALRGALVRDAEALLFAGAGIVDGSDPHAELAETRLKLQPLLGALMDV